MKTKRTLGPWIVNGSSVVANFPTDTKCVAEVNLISVVNGKKAPHSEQIGNLYLIAAAPDLLEACEEFCRKVESGQARSIKSYAQMKAAIDRVKNG